jgi:spore cortex biosynthesis protein YabQ
VTLYTQALTMLVMLVAGLLLGVLLDAYRIIKKLIPLRGWLLACTDLVYWLFAAYLVFGLLWLSNWGELRFYIFVSIITGFLLYMRCLSSGMSRVLHGLLSGLATVLGWLTQLIWIVLCLPIVKLFFVVRTVSLWIVIRLPGSIWKKWIRPLWQKNREKK